MSLTQTYHFTNIIHKGHCKLHDVYEYHLHEIELEMVKFTSIWNEHVMVKLLPLNKGAFVNNL